MWLSGSFQIWPLAISFIDTFFFGFIAFSSVGDVDNPAKIKTPCLGLFNGQCNDLAYSINPKGKNLERHQRSSSATMTRSAREAIACAASLSVVRAAKCS